MSLRATALVCLKDSVYFTQITYFFLFYTIIFTRHSHQFIYYTYFFIKIIFSSLSLLFPTYPHLTHKVSASHFPLTLKLSASLSPNPQSRCLSLISQSLYISFFFFFDSSKATRKREDDDDDNDEEDEDPLSQIPHLSP